MGVPEDVIKIFFYSVRMYFSGLDSIEGRFEILSVP